MAKKPKYAGGVQLPFNFGMDQPPELPAPYSWTLVADSSTFEGAIRRIKDDPNPTIDTETKGLYPWKGEKIAGVSVLTGHQAFYFPFRHLMGFNLPIEWLREGLIPAIQGSRWIGHNIKFDVNQFWYDGCWVPDEVEDTMLAAHLMNENERDLRLESLAEKYIDEEKARDGQRFLNATLLSYSIGKGDMWKLPSEKVAPYACFDVYWSLKLRDFYLHHLERWGLEQIWREVNAYSLVFARAEIRGIQLNPDLVEQYRDEANAHCTEYRDRIWEIAGYPLNLASSKQLQGFLGMASTAKEFLEPLAGRDPRVDLVLKWRAWDKMRGSYYDPFLDKMDSSGVLHPNNRVNGTVTGRISCTDPNMTAIPRQGHEEKIRKVKDTIVARPGYTLVQLDYSQAEVRLGAHYIRDQNMLQILSKRGADIHAETAKEIGIPRQAGKTLNFSVIYGIGGPSLAKDLGIEEHLAYQYLKQYHTKRPGFRVLMNAAEAQAESRRYIRLWTGRTRRYNRPDIETHKAMSNLIQGGVAEIIRTAMLKIDKVLRGEDAYQLLQVHDSVLMEMREEDVSRLAPEVANIMEDFDFTCPMYVDTSVGSPWSQQEGLAA